jgi:hypothetical protein
MHSSLKLTTASSTVHNTPLTHIHNRLIIPAELGEDDLNINAVQLLEEFDYDVET